MAQDFTAILAAPDDADLNLTYARDQARAGNLTVSASTLERILINDPNRHSVRLFYAVVLYRLGDLQSASDELRRLEAVPLTPEQRAEAASYRRRIDQGLATRSMSGSLAVGLVYEDDAAGAYFTAFDFIGAAPSEEGLSSDVSLTLLGRAGVGSGRVYEVFAEGFLNDRSALSGAAIDIQRAGLDLGLIRTTRSTRSRLSLFGHHVRLLGEPQLTEAGVRGDTRWRVSNATTLTGRAEAVSQDFDEPGVDALAPLLGGDRYGERFSLGVGISHRFTSRLTVSGGLDYEIKTATYEPFGFQGPRVYALVSQRFDKGVYALGSASVRWLDYEAADTLLLNGAVREDVRTHARVALGAPLSAFTARGATGDVREHVSIEGALNYTSRESSAPLSDFDGWGAELRLVWRFGARE